MSEQNREDLAYEKKTSDFLWWKLQKIKDLIKGDNSLRAEQIQEILDMKMSDWRKGIK